jgi:hypothetical protein
MRNVRQDSRSANRQGQGRLHAARALLRKVLASVVEALDEAVADAVRGALEAVELGEVEARAAESVLDVLHNVSLERLLVVAEILLHQAPQQMVALLFFGGRE